MKLILIFFTFTIFWGNAHADPQSKMVTKNSDKKWSLYKLARLKYNLDKEFALTVNKALPKAPFEFKFLRCAVVKLKDGDEVGRIWYSEMGRCLWKVFWYQAFKSDLAREIEVDIQLPYKKEPVRAFVTWLPGKAFKFKRKILWRTKRIIQLWKDAHKYHSLYLLFDTPIGGEDLIGIPLPYEFQDININAGPSSNDSHTIAIDVHVYDPDISGPVLKLNADTNWKPVFLLREPKDGQWQIVGKAHMETPSPEDLAAKE